jgi:hypothetical protein
MCHLRHPRLAALDADNATIIGAPGPRGKDAGADRPAKIRTKQG